MRRDGCGCLQVLDVYAIGKVRASAMSQGFLRVEAGVTEEA